ncbi:MAG: SDR family NAD(P)-dependent oxidoreductase [Gammaproteobacteria bacterium]
MDLSKSAAVISGGASGLGRAVAARVIDAGGQACLLDINTEQGQATAAELGDRVEFFRTDVTDEKAVDAAVAASRERMGRVSLAVSCAGVIGAGRVLGREGPMPGEQFARTININLLGTFYLIKASADAMQNNEPEPSGERGVIVNTASVAAFEGQIGQVAYSASKGAVVGLTLPVARELARIGVRVMTIAPGIFETPMMASVTEDFRRSLEVQVPFPSRLGRADEYADLVAHIYQNEMLNGTTIRLDGAIRMQPK